MDFPRLIHLDEDVEMRLKSYLEVELLNHYGERSSWVNDLKTLQDDYFAEPTQQTRNFPFRGAANIVIPLEAIVVEALHSNSMTSLFALDDVASVKVPGIYEDLNWGLQKWTNYTLLENGADLYRFADNSILEILKFGTGVGKSGYEKIEKTAIKTQGDKEFEFTVVTKQGATAEAVGLSNFLMPFYAQDPQTAPWCGEEHIKTAYEVKGLCDSQFFYDDAWENLKNWVLQTNALELSSTTYRLEMEKLENRDPVWPKIIGFVELWMCWDIDGSGKEKEIVVYYHRLSRTILGIRYNWYDDLRRPYRYCKYFNVENRWPGIGVGKQVNNFQREITIQHRQRLDNATIANIRMFKINKMAGYAPGEPIFPGKLWFVDHMDDIQPLEAGEVYPSSFNDEIQTLNYAQQRSGINELRLGMPQVGTPGTASSDMARLQEGNKKSDYTNKNIRKYVTEISRDVIYNECQFGVRNVEIFNYIPRGEEVRQFVENMDLSLLRKQLIMNINIIGAGDNKLQDRANWTQIGGLLTQYYTQMNQFAMEVKDVQLISMLAKYIPSGATEAMKQILETFPNVRNIDRILPLELILGYQPDLQNNPAIAGAIQQNPSIAGLLNPGSGNTNGSEGSSNSRGNGGSANPIQVQGMGNSSPGY